MSICLCMCTCMYTLLRKYTFQKYTNIYDQWSFTKWIPMSKYITSTRSGYRTLAACQPVLLTEAATIYQASLQLLTKVIIPYFTEIHHHIVPSITADYHDLFLNFMHVLFRAQILSLNILLRDTSILWYVEKVSSFSLWCSFPIYCNMTVFVVHRTLDEQRCLNIVVYVSWCVHTYAFFGEMQLLHKGHARG